MNRVKRAPAGTECPAWAEYGDPQGIPLLYHHGMPGAHPEAALLDKRARTQGIRIIAPDRPGIGLTAYRPVPSLVDLVAPCCALLDHLGIASCHQVGWSSGGPVALAMAARAPERVRAVFVMASYTHFHEAGERQALSPGSPEPERLLEASVPGSIKWLVNVMRWTGRWFPRIYLGALERLCTTADRDVLAQPEVRRQLMEAQKMSFRQGRQGAHQDLMLQYRDWGFRLAEVQARVLLFHGLDDRFVLPDNGRDLAERLPDCELCLLEGQGHLFPMNWEFQNQWLRHIRQQ